MQRQLLSLQLPAILLLCCFHVSALPSKPDENVTLPQTHKGTLDIDTRLLDSYGRPPEKRRQFYLDSRKILVGNADATLSDPRIAELAVKADIGLISGPILGEISHDSVMLQFRPGMKGTAYVEVVNLNVKGAKPIIYIRGWR